MIIPRGYRCGTCAGQGWFVRSLPNMREAGEAEICPWCYPLMKRDLARGVAELKSLASACRARGAGRGLAAFVARCRARSLDRRIARLERKIRLLGVVAF